MTQDSWQQDPEAHDYIGPVIDLAVHGVTRMFPPEICQRCGQGPEPHSGARIPTDQVLRRLPETVAPRLIP